MMSSRRRRLKGLKKKTKPYNTPKPEDLDGIVGTWMVCLCIKLWTYLYGLAGSLYMLSQIV